MNENRDFRPTIANLMLPTVTTRQAYASLCERNTGITTNLFNYFQNICYYYYLIIVIN